MNAPDRMPLPDIQSLADLRNQPINRVGVKGLRYPVQLRMADGSVQATVAQIAMTVALGADVKGTHMSRFIEVLEGTAITLDPASLRAIMLQMLERLGAAEGQPHQRALERHEHRKTGSFGEGHFGMEADAALAGPEGHIVLDTIAFENLDRSIIQANRHADHERTLGHAEAGRDVRIEMHHPGGFLKLLDGVAVEVARGPDVGSGDFVLGTGHGAVSFMGLRRPAGSGLVEPVRDRCRAGP